MLATERDRAVELLAVCHDRPDLFNDVILRRAPYWWRQIEICRSVVRYKTTVVVAGNATGKDYAIGGIIPWWLYTRTDALTVVIGPSQTLLGTVTWKELRRSLDQQADRMRLPFGVRVSEGAKASPHIVDLGGGQQALGLASNAIERLSGQHATNMLVVIEEASGIEDWAWEAIRGLNPAKLVVIGNPIASDSGYHKLAKRGIAEALDPDIPDDERVNTIRIPATDSPDIAYNRSPRGLADRGFLLEAERDYGRDSLWWLVHVAAQFPDASHDALLLPAWIHRMATVERAKGDGGRRRMGVDLGYGTGNDAMVVFVRDNLGILVGRESRWADVPEAASQVASLSSRWGVRPEDITYDAAGPGRDMPRYLAAHGIMSARPYYGSASGGPKAVNKRSRVAWKLRQRLDPKRPILPSGEVRKPWLPSDSVEQPVAREQPPFALPPDRPWWPRLADELEELRYRMEGRKVALELKEDLAARLGRSPDRVDALIMTFDGDGE